MADNEVIKAQVHLRTDGIPPQNDLDIVCAAAAGAYGPRLQDIATNGLGFIAAHLRHARHIDGSLGSADGDSSTGPGDVR